jgi:cell division transport system ATP-binding protein
LSQKTDANTVATPAAEKPMPLILLKDVERRYFSNKQEINALIKINLQIDNGEFVSLVGPSGAGKSTLIRLLTREEIPTAGEIYIAGLDITKLKSKELPYYRRKIGVVFQDYKLISYLNVWENIMFALSVSDATDDEIRDRIPKILELVGLQERSKAYPNELSGGEKQRVSVARALIHSPKILIADEPTGNLDPQNTLEVIDLFKRINSTGACVILATHNQAVVDELKNRVIVMKDGQIISDKKQSGYQS